MANELQVFKYNGAELRTVKRDSEPWFVAKDVANILGFRDAFNATMNLDDDEKDTAKVSTLGGMQDMTVISESGLYTLILRSNKPEAKPFRRWVTHDVLPQIRKTGMYLTDEKLEQYKTAPKAFDMLLDKYVAEQEKTRQLQEQLERTRPLTNLGVVVMAQKGAITFQSAAQFLSQHGIDTGQNKLFKWCRDKKLLCSRKGRQWNKPTQAAIERGLFNVEVSGGFNAITMITPTGMSYLTNELLSEAYPLLMLMEIAG